jgi:hypothetical protein
MVFKTRERKPRVGPGIAPTFLSRKKYTQYGVVAREIAKHCDGILDTVAETDVRWECMCLDF